MEACEPILVCCPTCGARYRVRGEDVFRLDQTACAKCRGRLQEPAAHLRARPVREDQILSWLQHGLDIE